MGLVVIIHEGFDVPLPKSEKTPLYLDQMCDLMARHPKTAMTWAHTGLGRVIRPPKGHASNLAAILSDQSGQPLEVSCFFTRASIAAKSVRIYLLSQTDPYGRMAEV